MGKFTKMHVNKENDNVQHKLLSKPGILNGGSNSPGAEIRLAIKYEIYIFLSTSGEKIVF